MALTRTGEGANPDGAMAVDCDVVTARIEAACEYASGATFSIHVHVTDPPDTMAACYFAFQAKVRWNDAQLRYLPAVTASDERLLLEWCVIPMRIDNQPGDPSLAFGCVEIFAASSMSTGPVLVFEMQCQVDGNTPIELVPRPGDTQAGTFFANASFGAIDPTLTNATVLCGTKPTPTDTLTPTLTPTPTPTDTATATPTPTPAVDSDLDGCSDVAELQPKSEVATGGGRDPLYYWDFMDMWVNKQKDRRVNIIDIGAIVRRFFAMGDPGGDPLDPPQALTTPDLHGYHAAFDRGGADPEGNLWHLFPPDGQINSVDIWAMVAQFGHSCL